MTSGKGWMSNADHYNLVMIYQAWPSFPANIELRLGEPSYEAKIATVRRLKPISKESARKKYESLTRRLVTEEPSLRADNFVRYVCAVDALCARKISKGEEPVKKVSRLEWGDDGHHP